MRDTDDQQTNLILDFFLKYYKPLIIFPLIASITALIVSFTLRKEYEAHAEIFPTQFSTLDQNLDNPIMGYDVEADRLLKVLNSRSLQDSIVRKFDLVSYWEIDTTKKNYKYFLNKKFVQNIKFRRTMAMSIVVSVYSYDPDFSVAIANEIIKQVDVIRERMLKSNIHTSYESNYQEMIATKQKMDTLLVQIKTQREENNIYFPALHQTIMSNNSPESNGPARTDLEKLVDEYNLLMDHYRGIYAKVEKAEQMISNPIPKVYVLDDATTDYKKKYPKTTLNILGSFLVSFVFMVILILIRSEFLKRFRTKKLA